MGLNCGCPTGISLPFVDLAGCNESIGQIQKIIFQRIYFQAGEKNTLGLYTNAADKAKWQDGLMSPVGDRMIITPYVQNPSTEPGAARKFGGGNATVGGIEVIVGREPSTFSAVMYNTKQSIIKELKKLMCEELGVYLVNEYGNLVGIKNEVDSKVYPIPIKSLFIGDKKVGGLEEPDANTVEFYMYPNWSDDLCYIKPSTWSPLTDITNIDSSEMFETISGLTIGSTNKKVYLKVDADKRCLAILPTGEVYTSAGGVIDKVYSGSAGSIRLMVPKNNSVEVSITKTGFYNADFAGIFTSNIACQFNFGGCLLNEIYIPNATAVSCGGSINLEALDCPKATAIYASSCAQLPIINLKSILDDAYTLNLADPVIGSIDLSGTTQAVPVEDISPIHGIDYSEIAFTGLADWDVNINVAI